MNVLPIEHHMRPKAALGDLAGHEQPAPFRLEGVDIGIGDHPSFRAQYGRIDLRSCQEQFASTLERKRALAEDAMIKTHNLIEGDQIARHPAHKHRPYPRVPPMNRGLRRSSSGHLVLSLTARGLDAVPVRGKRASRGGITVSPRSLVDSLRRSKQQTC